MTDQEYVLKQGGLCEPDGPVRVQELVPRPGDLLPAGEGESADKEGGVDVAEHGATEQPRRHREEAAPVLVRGQLFP